ncbi:hypothetical protein LTR05_000130 [Lithohypha guttulata]|uniref:Peptidase S33 tripeptidyl aminopeptidase-like C-terminal domain-containing protein n=1 Tax=Lithohypha guttulata TaxID=1690604 RepID=A0AAN7T4Y6_9EURO|nr:hypothetical protein LTR05_000130 [Lithohypha guttulata]
MAAFVMLAYLLSTLLFQGMVPILLLSAWSLAGLANARKPNLPLQGLEISGFDWSKIEPSANLQWTSCYESYECARLLVPLDWTNSSNPNFAAVALTRVPAVVPRNDSTFAGSILINPGGPGGSGIDEVIWSGYGVRDEIVDNPGKQHWEIVGWDPRGVHHTTPGLTCFGSDWDRQIWQYRDWAVGQLGSNDHALDIKWATHESLANLCAESKIGKFEDDANMHQFVSTALTARDMVAIVDALQAEQKSLSSSIQSANHVLQQPVRPEKPALLNYWGWSYGTYLGNTFASMFPNRVGRIILDGNVDPIDYTATGWLSNLYDNNKNLHWFYYSCFHAGKKCAFFDSNTTSLSDLEKKMHTLLNRLRNNPLAVAHNGSADLVTYDDMANLIHGAAYAPRYFWPDVAQVAQDLLNNNGTSIIKYLKSLQIPQSPNTNTPTSPDDHKSLVLNNETLPYPPDYSGGLEGAISILCGDGESLNGLTKHDWKQRFSQLNNQSAIAGPFWAAIPFMCQHWPSSLRPADQNRFKGPFQSRLADYDERASPLLFIGNTADPVTPLRNAIGNSRHHEGSRVLTQDSPGHCAGPVNPSTCTFEVIRSFFANGTLPEIGKVCTIDGSPWD